MFPNPLQHSTRHLSSGMRLVWRRTGKSSWQSPLFVFIGLATRNAVSRHGGHCSLSLSGSGRGRKCSHPPSRVCQKGKGTASENSTRLSPFDLIGGFETNGAGRLRRLKCRFGHARRLRSWKLVNGPRETIDPAPFRFRRIFLVSCFSLSLFLFAFFLSFQNESASWRTSFRQSGDFERDWIEWKLMDIDRGWSPWTSQSRRRIDRICYSRWVNFQTEEAESWTERKPFK